MIVTPKLRPYLRSLSIFLLLLFITGDAFADITGKVIGVADGNTITVLQSKKQFKIRLYGVDSPELKRQAYGNKAKQYTSDMVLGKVVRVVVKDKDRYGRMVGIVYQDRKCLNESLIRTGYAWVYNQYCKNCGDWKRLEESARKNRVGLWQDKNPVPPWEFRKIKRAAWKGNNSIPDIVVVYTLRERADSLGYDLSSVTNKEVVDIIRYTSKDKIEKINELWEQLPDSGTEKTKETQKLINENIPKLKGLVGKILKDYCKKSGKPCPKVKKKK